MTLFWIILGVCIGAGLIFALALGASAARADRMLGYKDPEPNAIEEYLARAEQSRLRTYGRLGIRELPGKTHVGQDTRKDGLR